MAAIFLDDPSDPERMHYVAWVESGRMDWQTLRAHAVSAGNAKAIRVCDEFLTDKSARADIAGTETATTVAAPVKR